MRKPWGGRLGRWRLAFSIVVSTALFVSVLRFLALIPVWQDNLQRVTQLRSVVVDGKWTEDAKAIFIEKPAVYFEGTILHFRLGEAYETAGDREMAIVEYEAALVGVPAGSPYELWLKQKAGSLRIRVGREYLRTGKYIEAAVEHLQKALEMRPYDLYGWNYLGQAYEARGDRAKSAVAYKQLQYFKLEDLRGDLHEYLGEVVSNLPDKGAWYRNIAMNILSYIIWQT